MCGRFFLDAKNREIDRLLENMAPDSPPVQTGEVFPTNMALALALHNGRMRPEAMVWGFPRFDGKGVVFNARRETALEKPMFAAPLKNHPAIIPVSGFYEWRQDGDSRRKSKYLFCDSRDRLLYLAGFWKIFRDLDGASGPRFTILTTVANTFMRPYHSRMPVLLEEDETEAWLAGENREEVLSRMPSENLSAVRES